MAFDLQQFLTSFLTLVARQYAFNHVKTKELANFNDILPLVSSYCDKIQSSFDYFYDFNG